MPRVQLGERTALVVELRHVVGACIAIGLAFGGWLWRVQEQVFAIHEDVSVLRARYDTTNDEDRRGRPGDPTYPPSYPVAPTSAPTPNDRRDWKGNP